ncbi:MAG: hypothetical protein FWH12_04465 [Treponema sp.]|nr:hypothetical protein [Treponema sp.]
MDLLLPLPIVLPIISGLVMGFCPALKEKKIQRIFLISSLSLTMALVLIIAFQWNLRLNLFSITLELNILLQSDRLARFFTVLTAAMFLLVGIYSPRYMEHEGNESRFYMFFFLAQAMLLGVGYAGNLITLYIFFEMMSLLSAPLVLHSMSKTAIAAAFKFVYYSILGATLVLVGFFCIYAYGGSLEFTPGGVLDDMFLEGHEGLMLTGTMLAILGFSAKAGMFPLHAWLPTAHPVAPAPASALLSGIITKAGVLAVIRFVFYLVGADFVRGTWVQTVWLSLALVSVLLGAVLAFKEPVLKRRLAYSTISQVSYVMFGLATLSMGSFVGAMLHLTLHSLVKDALFLTAGIIIIQTGKTDVADLRGIGKTLPLSIFCFTILALCAVGIPPTGGFISKWYLATSSLAANLTVFSWLGPALLLLSALLAAGYLFPISINGFFPGRDFQGEGREAGPSMLIPLVVLSAAAVLLGTIPGPLISFFSSIVMGLM